MMTLDQWVASTEALLDLDAKGALVPHGIGGHARTLLEDALTRATTRPVPAPVGVNGEITAYEMQVLIGTTISGCNMPPDRIFDLPKAWERLRALGLIDRTDGLAIATDKGRAIILSALTSPQTSEAPHDQP